MTQRAQKTRFEEFDAWFWMNSHKEFCEQSSNFCPLFAKNSRVLKYVRLFGFICSSILILLLWYNAGFDIAVFKFFTVWGIYATLACYAAGTWIAFHQSEDAVFDEAQKHNLFCAWKIYIFMFEIAVSIEIVITLVFWLLLWEEAKNHPFYEPPMRKLGLVLDHGLPIVILTLDYVVNATPIICRHLLIIAIICLFYLFVNFYATKMQGFPVYGPMSWDSVTAVLFALALWAFGASAFLVLYKLNLRKLKFYGSFEHRHNRIVEICSGNLNSFAN